MKKGLTIGLVAGLLVGVGGTAAAASRYVITSAKQIKPSVRRTLQGKAGALGATGPSGARGPAGQAGPAGPVGPAGAFSTGNVFVVHGAAVTVGPGGVAGSYASCPSGAVALGGGYAGPLVHTDVSYDFPIALDTAWDVVIVNDSSIAETLTPYATCASSTGAVAHARRAAATTAARTINERNIARVKTTRRQ